MKTLINNGHVIDPSQNISAVMDVLVEDGIIKAIGATLEEKVNVVFDANGLVVAPVFIDVYTHLREPRLAASDDITQVS